MTEEKTTTRTAPSRPSKSAEETPKPKNTITRRMRSGDDEFQVEVAVVNGREVLAENVYKTTPLPNTKKTTQILVASKGTVFQG